MAYRKKGSRSGARRSTGRRSGYTKSSSSRRRTSSNRRSAPREIRIVIEQPGANPMARPDLLGMKPAAAPKKSMF